MVANTETSIETPITDRDALDFRDRIYTPSLKPLPRFRIPNPAYMARPANQHTEGSCTGFGLAAVINYLNAEQAGQPGSRMKYEPVSERMLYEMAKTHDRWPGVSHQGSSARGAMKGWHKNGVCRRDLWEYIPGNPGELTREAQLNALKRPLGAYYRVLPKRSDLFAALCEVPALFVTARIHSGWHSLEAQVIPWDGTQVPAGGHAFAVLGYTDEGFIVQNSWGEEWGGLDIDGTHMPGVALWTFPDFEANVWDVWVSRMALPVESLAYLDPGRFVEGARGPEARERAPARSEIQHHYVHIDDGQLDPRGDYPTTRTQLGEIMDAAFDGTCSHLLLYAHGGLNSVKGSASRAAKWQPVFRENGIHEIHFIWETGLLAELRDVLLGKEEFANERAAGITDWTDLWIERLSYIPGHALWKEMTSDARIAFDREAAGTEVVGAIVNRYNATQSNARPRIHLAGHSAGSILLGHLLNRWKALDGPSIENLALFAPACTRAFYEDNIRPALTRRKSQVERLHHFLLSDEFEADDHVGYVYRKSLLYLVSRSFQQKGEVVPLMGMDRYWPKIYELGPKNRIVTHRSLSGTTTSRTHGGFDNDKATMNALLKLILGDEPSRPFNPDDLAGY